MKRALKEEWLNRLKAQPTVARGTWARAPMTPSQRCFCTAGVLMQIFSEEHPEECQFDPLRNLFVDRSNAPFHHRMNNFHRVIDWAGLPEGWFTSLIDVNDTLSPDAAVRMVELLPCEREQPKVASLPTFDFPLFEVVNPTGEPIPEDVWDEFDHSLDLCSTDDGYSDEVRDEFHRRNPGWVLDEDFVHIETSDDWRFGRFIQDWDDTSAAALVALAGYACVCLPDWIEENGEYGPDPKRYTRQYCSDGATPRRVYRCTRSLIQPKEGQ